ncbi:RDD family protein [Salinigranum rubrum]|uniref:RDD family protein n=1 Tax=Salinigranum rubrum TaxID=755307 RepID=UPI001C1F3EC2|nr:RDD family protein [Salinigranum rubrum]
MERPRPQLGTENSVVVKRVLAFVIDVVLLAVVVGIAGAIFGALLGRLGGILTPLLSLVGVVYFIYMEGTYGQTLGKRLVGIVVVDEDGGACDMTASAIRNVLRLVDALPTLYIVGFAVMYLVSDRKQRVGDLVGDTVVVEAA